uniref:Uncharacterized protein n=1 Tax=Corethron hystrix TaxID=216773 RepID=A0A7S1G2H1_9STRA|mmetsp:Transcript_8999/g.19911  ORF Transcript_8999/g.19911 Transcript_8999/m.19911 type:complete len:179 (+) Transcript_8999:53-589(+)
MVFPKPYIEDAHSSSRPKDTFQKVPLQFIFIALSIFYALPRNEAFAGPIKRMDGKKSSERQFPSLQQKFSQNASVRSPPVLFFSQTSKNKDIVNRSNLTIREWSTELLGLLKALTEWSSPRELTASDGGTKRSSDDRIDQLIRLLVDSRSLFDPMVSLNGPFFATVYVLGPTPLWEKN